MFYCILSVLSLFIEVVWSSIQWWWIVENRQNTKDKYVNVDLVNIYYCYGFDINKLFCLLNKQYQKLEADTLIQSTTNPWLRNKLTTNNITQNKTLSSSYLAIWLKIFKSIHTLLMLIWCKQSAQQFKCYWLWCLILTPGLALIG